MGNYYERYYPQAFVESWHFPWLLKIDSHRLVDYSHPPLVVVIQSHARYRALCFKEGWSLDYTKFYPEYFLKTALVDSESWLYSYRGDQQHSSLFTDVFLLSWMLCKPDYIPGTYTIRDLDYKTHLVFDLPRYAVSPASAIHDVSGDVLSLYPNFF